MNHRRLITRLILWQREASDGELFGSTRSHHNRLSGRKVNVISTAVVLDSWAKLPEAGAGQRCHQYKLAAQGNHLPPYAELLALRCKDQ